MTCIWCNEDHEGGPENCPENAQQPTHPLNQEGTLMDPNACLRLAIAAETLDEWLEHSENYADWLGRGGFDASPDLVIAMADRLAVLVP